MPIHTTTDPGIRAGDIARREAIERWHGDREGVDPLEVEAEVYDEVLKEQQPALPKNISIQLTPETMGVAKQALDMFGDRASTGHCSSDPIYVFGIDQDELDAARELFGQLGISISVVTLHR